MAPPREEGDEATLPVPEPEVVSLIEKVLKHGLTHTHIRLYCLTALMKLTTRLEDPTVLARIRELIGGYQNAITIEIQQRACEYTNAFQFDDIRKILLEHMPTIEDVERDTPHSPSSPAKQMDMMSMGTGSGGTETGEYRSLEDIMGQMRRAAQLDASTVMGVKS